jgi:hypothetical protein
VAKAVQQMPETLHDRSLHRHRNGGELLGFDLLCEVREDRGDIVDTAGRPRITQQVKSRQRCRRDHHRAGIGLAVLDPLSLIIIYPSARPT